MDFDALIPVLEIGTINVAASGIIITENHAKKVVFTSACYDSGLTIVVLKTNDKIKDFNDLQGKRLGAQISTTSAMEVEKI